MFVTKRSMVIVTILLLMATLSIISITNIIAEETSIEEPIKTNENITITINPDATIGLSGTLEAVFTEHPGAYGEAHIIIQATPKYEEAGLKEFSFNLSGEGNLYLEEPPTNLTSLELVLDTTQNGGDSYGTLLFGILSEEIKGKGGVNITSTVQNNTITMTLSANLNLDTEIDEETVMYIQKQLQQITPETMNLAMIQSGMTFLKFTKLDLSGLEVSTNGIHGTAVLEMQMSIDDYITWYKGMLYTQGLTQEEIEQETQSIETLFNEMTNPENQAELHLMFKLQGNNLQFELNYNGKLTGTTVNAYMDYFQTLMKTPTTIAIGEETIPVEENFYMGSETNITIAMKPIDIAVDYTSTEQGSTLKVQINSIYLKNKGIDLGYEGALQVLHDLATENATTEDMIEQLTILVTPYEGKTPTLKLEKPINGNIIVEEANKIVLENVMPTELRKISLENIPEVTSTPTETKTSVEETTTSEMGETGAETTVTTNETGLNTGLIAGIVVVIAIAAIVGFVLKR